MIQAPGSHPSLPSQLYCVPTNKSTFVCKLKWMFSSLKEIKNAFYKSKRNFVNMIKFFITWQFDHQGSYIEAYRT
jgi:hypothetical protein